MAGINVPIGAAVVEFGTGADLVKFDITKGGINFSVSTSVQEVTVDQYGDTPVKVITKGRKAEVTVPFALHDLAKLAKVMPNSVYTKAAVGSAEKIVVKAEAGIDLSALAKKLVIKPSDPLATANDWITIPLAASLADPDYTYSPEGERVCNITFTAFPDTTTKELYILGDVTAV